MELKEIKLILFISFIAFNYIFDTVIGLLFIPPSIYSYNK